MGKKVKISKDFVLKAHKEACSDWKKRIEEELPELFENTLEVGKWYKEKFEHKNIIFIVSIDDDFVRIYGFDMRGGWMKLDDRSINGEYIKSTDKEVEEALIKEAKKRGFKNGVTIIPPGYGTPQKILFSPIFHSHTNKMNVSSPEEEWDKNCSNPPIFENGKWAEIIEEEMTLEDVCKELGRTIKIKL